MTSILAQIAPQRSTQYSALASALAPHELQLCPVGGAICSDVVPVTLGGQEYLRFDLGQPLDIEQSRELGLLSTCSAFFLFHDSVGGVPGPFLQPLETGFTPSLPPQLVTARRYRGKTNELFTHFLCNVARYSSFYARQPWSSLRLYDPLAGGGTTLFTALILGADAAGVEKSAQDIKSTVAFLRQFTREQRISSAVQEERLRKLGQRWTYTLGKNSPQRCILVRGDTAQSAALLGGFKPHLIVADLPYGIQHQGPLIDLLSEALPVWASLLPKGGALVYSWDATRFPREEMLALVERVETLQPHVAPPYDRLAHGVDRVIKERDVLVARRI